MEFELNAYVYTILALLQYQAQRKYKMEHDMSDSNFLLEQLRSDVGGMEQEQLRRRRRSRSLSFPQVRFGRDSYGCWKVLSEFLLLAAPIKFWGCQGITFEKVRRVTNRSPKMTISIAGSDFLN